jgi:hypothetical protein
LNVNAIVLLTETPVAPAAGLIAVTVGCVVFATPDVPVVNVLVSGTTVFPAWSVNPLTFTVYTVLVASKVPGVKVSVVWLLLKLIAPLTGVEPADTVIALLPTLTALTGALTTATTWVFTGVPAVPLGGLTWTTVGAVVTFPDPVVKAAKKVASPSPATRSVIPLVALIS